MYINSKMREEAKKAKFQPNIALLLLFVLLIFVIAYVLPQMILGKVIDQFEAHYEVGEIAYLFLNILPILAGILYCTNLEKRSLRSMGFTKEKITMRYLVGLGIGAAFMAVIICSCVLLGVAAITSYQIAPPVAFLFFIGYIIQGMSEEIALRSCLTANRSPHTGSNTR